MVVVLVKSLRCVWLFVTPWTVARQAPLSMGILQARILEWISMPFPWPRDQTLVSSIAGGFLHWQMDSLPLSHQGSPGNLGLFGQMRCNSNFIIQAIFYMNANFLSSYCESESHSVVSNSLWPHELQLARLLCPWGFSRQEYWSGLPFPPPGDLPRPGIAIVNSAKMNTGIHMSFSVIIFSGYMPSSGIVGSYVVLFLVFF